jgi:ATP-dependent Clp protease ATP-binding subunit ClpC
MSLRARSALEQGLLVARWYYQPHVDTEHLLIGLAREHECVAARVLADLGIDAARLLQRFEQTPLRAEQDRVGYTAAARAALERGATEARQRGHATFGTGHMLLGLVLVDDSRARALLEQLGVAVDKLPARVEPYLAAEPEG